LKGFDIKLSILIPYLIATVIGSIMIIYANGIGIFTVFFIVSWTILWFLFLFKRLNN
jgi:hypothetical protein